MKKTDLKFVDSTVADIKLVGSHHKVLGRPTLTIVLDKFSRLICGYHVTFAEDNSGANPKSVRSALPADDEPKNRIGNTKI
jgi:hypothetical protein